MSSTYSPVQSPGRSRLLQLGVAGSSSRLRSSSTKKPPEPLRRAVADFLSSSPPPTSSHHGAIPSVPPSEALRNLQEMLCSTKAACRICVFDLILNLGVHAQLLEPMRSDNATTIEEAYAQESYIDYENRLLLQGTRTKYLPKMSSSSSSHPAITSYREMHRRCNCVSRSWWNVVL